MGATGQVIKYFFIETEMKLIEFSLLISFLWKIGDRLSFGAKRLVFPSMANSEGPSAVVGPCEQSNKTQWRPQQATRSRHLTPQYRSR